jgi:hypothetical protein
MSDQFQFESSGISQMTDEPYRSKQWNYCNDQNQGNYASNQVVFDLSSFYNQNKFIAPSEMFLVVPVVSVLSTNAVDGLNAKQNDWSLGYKSGYYNIISSMQIDYNNKTVQQLTPNLNYYVSFKMNSTMSKSSVDTIGSAIGVYPDNPTSWSYANGAAAIVGAYGNGVRNNYIHLAPTNTDQSYGGTYIRGNDGAFKRRLSTSFAISDDNGSTLINTAAQPNSEFMNNTQGTDAYQAYYTTMVIRLSDVSDFFASMPLTKGFYARLTLNLNLGSLAINRTGGSQNTRNQLSLVGTNINFPNGTCPLMIQPSTTAQYTDDVNEIICGIYVGRVSSSLGTRNQNTLNVPPHPLNSCRIYAPSIDLQPSRALSYIQENRSKYIEWDDVYATKVNVLQNQTFNYNITNSLAGIHAIVIIPFISGTEHGVMTGMTSPFSPAISPFATEPATTSPLLSISQFNVQLAGENVLANLLNYTFEEFLEQLAPSHAVNGGHSLELSSGLIDLVGFQNIYRYYYVDLSRRAKDDIGAKGITIMGKNDNIVGMDLFCFVVHKKSASLDVETGILEMRV